jgi:outer membrane biosynthesis protein TonB
MEKMNSKRSILTMLSRILFASGIVLLAVGLFFSAASSPAVAAGASTFEEPLMWISGIYGKLTQTPSPCPCPTQTALPVEETETVEPTATETAEPTDTPEPVEATEPRNQPTPLSRLKQPKPRNQPTPLNLVK